MQIEIIVKGVDEEKTEYDQSDIDRSPENHLWAACIPGLIHCPVFFGVEIVCCFVRDLPCNKKSLSLLQHGFLEHFAVLECDGRARSCDC